MYNIQKHQNNKFLNEHIKIFIILMSRKLSYGLLFFS